MKLLPGGLAVLGLLICGCAVYRPKSPIPASYSKQVLADVSSATLMKDYNAMPESSDAEKAAKVARRNQVLAELIYLVDQNYYTFENHFYGTQATFNTATDAVSLGLTAAGSVVGSTDIKSILSAAATGNTGLQSSVEKNFFDQQSRAAVVTKMRALRATQLALMEDENHMKAGITGYSIETALSDANAYYDAGTIVAALQSIAQSAGQDTAAAADKQKTNSAKKQAIQ